MSIRPPEILTLSNGIPVILQHQDAPVAATYWWVRTGSADERPEEAGFAHFLEHMLFKDAAAKDTGKASTGQLAQAIESLGGDINAYTSFDQTVYHFTCAAHHWESILDQFGTMAKPQEFLKSDFDREREVILEELRRNNDSPGRQLFQSLFTSTFKKHPYGRPVIGFERTLKAAKVQKLEAFYKSHYVPERMGLILVGPIGEPTGARRKRLVKLLEKRFGKGAIPKRTTRASTRAVEPELRSKITTVIKRFDVKTPTLAIAFRVPELSHPDLPALDVVSSILSMGELSRIYQRLFYKEALVTDSSGGLYVPRDPGMLYFSAEMERIDQIEPAAYSLLDEIARVRKNGPTPEEMARVITNIESERLYATQTADGLAGRLGFLQFIMGDLTYDERYLSEIKALDADRVREIASKYLDPRRLSITLLLPEGEKAFDLSKIEKRAQEILAQPEAEIRAKSAPAPAAAAEPIYTQRPSGLQVVFKPNSSSHVVSIHAAVLGGLRLELGAPIGSRETDWGASYLMSLTWTKGTRTRDAKKIAEIVEGRAASMDGYSGRNTVGLQVTGLARDWAQLSDLFAEVLLEPTFPESEVDHSRRVAEDSVRSIEDHSSQICSKIFLETLFESHPYGYMTLGSLESLKQIDSAKLRAFHGAWIRPERMVISVSGAVKQDELNRWLDALDARLASIARAPAKKLPDSLTPESPLKAPRWVERTVGREQSHILVGGMGTRIHADDRFSLRLLQNVLSGQSGRLFIELREKRSLAYSVSPISMEGVEPGYVGTYIGCAPGKREEAILGIKMVLEKLAAKGPTESELKRAREFYLGRRAMELQSDAAIAAHYGLEKVYGLPRWTDEDLAKRVRAVTGTQVKEACSKYCVEPPMVTAVVV